MSEIWLSILITLACALVFPFSALLFERAMEESRNTWGVAAASNILLALLFQVFWFFPALGARNAPAWSALGEKGLWASGMAGAVLTGGLFFLGQVLAFKAYGGGEISIAVPAFGSKVIFVALLSAFLLGEEVPWTLWAGAVLTVTALFFLRESGGGTQAARRASLTLALALASSLAFAGVDIAIRKWAEGAGTGRFLALAFSVQGLLSLFLFAMPHPRANRKVPERLLEGLKDLARGRPEAAAADLRPVRSLRDAPVLKPLLLGSFIMSGVTAGISLAIALFGQPTLVNIVLNARSVFAVGAVWLLGRLFRNREARAGRKVMRARLIGACILLAGIAVALLEV